MFFLNYCCKNLIFFFLEKKLINHLQEEIPAAESLMLKENSISEIKSIIPPVPPPLCISYCGKKEIICIDLTLNEDVKEEKNDEQQQAVPDDDDMHDIKLVLKTVLFNSKS